MHIPDSFIPLDQAFIYAVIALPFIYRAILWARNELDEKAVPLFATLSAGIFAIQALNIPIPWGTSGHMVGGVLASILFGSAWAGVLVLTVVITIQAFIFADGGVTVLGANILNMAIISTFAGYYAYKSIERHMGIKKAAFLGGFTGLFISSLFVAMEMWIAGTFPLVPGLIFMGTYHFVIGIIGEGFITSIAVTAVIRSTPELFPSLLSRGVKN